MSELELPRPQPTEDVEEARAKIEKLIEAGKEKNKLDAAREELGSKIDMLKLEERMAVLEKDYAKSREEYETLKTKLLREKAQGKGSFPAEAEQKNNKLAELYPDLWQRYGKS